jgi:hypothetical protein
VEVVIRELDEQGHAAMDVDTVFCVPEEGRSLIRVKIARGQPALSVYHPLGHRPRHQVTAGVSGVTKICENTYLAQLTRTGRADKM